jgi:predicted DsbA family dithiol-disulfide isomerase
MNIAIDVVSDFVCPWCFIGKSRLKNAIELVGAKRPDAAFQINWLPYFLNPGTPSAGEPYRTFLEAKFGGAAQVDRMQQQAAEVGKKTGVEFDFARIAVRPNTLRAHRLVYRAQSIGHRTDEVEALVARLFVAHFQRGENIGDIATLVDIAVECGERRDDVASFLESAEGEQQVATLVRKVGDLGVTGVPFFIIQRRLAVSGAQTGEVLAAAIMQAIDLPA